MQFASRFATAFFHYFLVARDEDPISAGEAVYRARRFFWTNYRNIGGLLYTHSNDFDVHAGEEGE